MLKRNMGNVDRLVRIAVGVGLLAIVFVGPQTPLGYIGIVPLLTGIIGFCPAYCPLGLSTCRVPRQ
ncbi:MAG: DUF2892 domain-containing protein [Pirellulaceae bacterium]|nr:DUF2892 domain-containing protein [Pirellulaceae bacterium]